MWISFNDRLVLSRAYLCLDRSLIISLCKFVEFSGAIHTDTIRCRYQCGSLSSSSVSIASPCRFDALTRSQYHARKFEKRGASQLDRLKHRRYYIRIDSSDRRYMFCTVLIKVKLKRHLDWIKIEVSDWSKIRINNN